MRPSTKMNWAPPKPGQEAPPYFKDIGAFYDYCVKTWHVVEEGRVRGMMPRDIAKEINVPFESLVTELSTAEGRETAWRTIKAVRG